MIPRAERSFLPAVSLLSGIHASGAVRDGFTYGYDRSSQRTWKHSLAASAGDAQDEAYAYDPTGNCPPPASEDLRCGFAVLQPRSAVNRKRPKIRPVVERGPTG